jgi:GNAT superfamily N-acetyltransferase
MEIRRAQPEDAGILTEIAFAAKGHWGYPERLMQGWKEVLTIGREFIARNETYIAYADVRAVGFYALVSRAGKMSMEHLWVLPSAMGQGVGRALFTHAVQRAKALGVEAIEIESDPNAEGFYKRMGARRVGGNITEMERQQRVLPVLIYDCR